jgi:hypothetical protein
VLRKRQAARGNRHIKGPVQILPCNDLFQQGYPREASNLFAHSENANEPLPLEKVGLLPNEANRDVLQFWIAFEEANALLPSK